MGTGLLTDCSGLSLGVGQGFKGLCTERGALGGPLLPPHLQQEVIKGFSACRASSVCLFAYWILACVSVCEKSRPLHV